MEQAGFLPEDYEGDEVEVWPENWPALQVFCRLQTQWRVGANGATGLDYAVLFDLLDRSGYAGPDWFQMLDDVSEMERAALKSMRK